MTPLVLVFTPYNVFTRGFVLSGWLKFQVVKNKALILSSGWNLRPWPMLIKKEHIRFVFPEFPDLKIGLSCKWKLCFTYRKGKLHTNNSIGLVYILNNVDEKINSKFNASTAYLGIIQWPIFRKALALSSFIILLILSDFLLKLVVSLKIYNNYKEPNQKSN